MINFLLKFFIIILFIFIVYLNSHLFDFIYLKQISSYFYVHGNYEFSKTIFFNILSSIIFLLFFIKIFILKKQKLIFPTKIIFLIISIFFISSIFSIDPIISLFGNNDKNHSFGLFINLIGLYIVLVNCDNKFKKKLLFYLIINLIFISGFAIKELYFPLFDYGNLKNRAFGSFGHPNYLALYLLLFIDILAKNKLNLNKFLNYFILIIIIFTIFFTKNLFAIFILFIYFVYFFYKKNFFGKRQIFLLFFIFILTIFYIFQEFGFSKLDSFLSRFYIWKTTLLIIFKDIKSFFLGNSFETLDIFFDSFKVKELYIYENFGFTADRAHNIFIDIFYSLGIFGLILFIYLLIKLIKSNFIFKNSIIIAIIFLFFNFASISSYIIIILLLSFYEINNKNNFYQNIFNKIIVFFITSFSFFEAYYSYNFYISETYIYKGDLIKAKKNKIFQKKFYNYKTCEEKINSGIKSAENYIYCGNKYWNTNQKKAIEFYKLGLGKLPDLYNNNSIYFQNFFIKHNPQILHRFFNSKELNIKEILQRLEKN